MTHDGVSDAERNAKMLDKIVRGTAPSTDPMQNVVIVTSKWDRIDESQRSARESRLQGSLMQFYPPPRSFMRHDGTKFSALSIVNAAKKRNVIPFGLQNDLVTLNKRFIETGAGKELSSHIDTLIQNNHTEEADLRQKIDDARNDDDENRLQLRAEMERLGEVLAHLKNEWSVLRTPSLIAWEQATSNSNALESAIQAQRELATKNWKAEYDILMAKNRKLEGEYDTLMAKNRKLEGELVC